MHRTIRYCGQHNKCLSRLTIIINQCPGHYQGICVNKHKSSEFYPLTDLSGPDRAATPYRPGKNGFCKQHNTKGSGPADNIYFFYQRLWPGQIANTKSSLTLALGLMHLNFYLFYWPLLKNIFSQQVLDSNLSDNDGGLVDNEDDQEKEDSPMITDNDFDFLSNFLFTMSVCLTSTHLEHSISFRSVSAL